MMFFKATRWMIHPDTIAKISCTEEIDPQELKDLFHPSQLEERFGGKAKTPTQFWPPHMGTEFLPNGDNSHLELIKPEDYESVLE